MSRTASRVLSVAAMVALVSLVVGGAASSAPSGIAITADGAWARASAMPGMPGAAYLTIHNAAATDDVLVGVTTPTAGSVEMHASGDDGTGQMLMRPVTSIVVPGHGHVALAPGGAHLMLIDLDAQLVAGTSIDLTLTFTSGAIVTVTADVRTDPPRPTGSVAPATPAALAELQVLPISTQHWVGDNDLILQLFDAQSRPITDPAAPISLELTGPDGAARAPLTPLFGRWAVTGRDLYVARVRLDQVGTWTATVHIGWAGRTLEGSSTFSVSPDGGTPALGTRVPDVDTPTLNDVFNLADAISSDPRQVAAFYIKSVHDELINRQPFVFVLDSYAFRPNEACGGALGVIHDIFIEYPQLAVIHAEPWDMRFAAGQLTLEPPGGPATLAPWSVAYGVDTPPWIFVVDIDGRLRAKFNGVFGTDELRAAMSEVSTWRPLGAPASPAPAAVG